MFSASIITLHRQQESVPNGSPGTVQPRYVAGRGASLITALSSLWSEEPLQPHLAEDNQEAEGLTGGVLAPTAGCRTKHAPRRLSASKNALSSGHSVLPSVPKCFHDTGLGTQARGGKRHPRCLTQGKDRNHALGGSQVIQAH